MKKINLLKLILPVLGITTVAALAGSISSTIAWYAYSTRALVSYSGTSVSSTTQLQIGIKSDIRIQNFRNITENTTNFKEIIDEVTFTGDDNYYYFMKPGAGGMPAAVINEYLSQKGYTTNILEPLSTYTYSNDPTSANHNFNLMNRPTTNKPFDTRTNAEITKYVRIPFVFRVLADTATVSYVKNHEIFLSGADAVAASEQDGIINKAIRLYIDRDNGEDYLFNPNSLTDGSDKVSGVLDLSSDGYFDYDNNPASPTYNQEYIYGDYSFKNNNTWASCLTAGLEQSSDYVDINETGVTGRQTTFTSRHYRGVKHFHDLSNVESGVAEYYGKNTIFPHKNATTGDWESDYAVCKTANDDKALGSFDLVVYLEGWDFSVIDDELTHKFYLGLTFEINVVK